MSDPRLAKLPAVHALADDAAALGNAPRWAVIEAARQAVNERRTAILAGAAASAAIAAADVAERAAVLARPPLRRVINATGVVLHTNLGRAPLAASARAAIDDAASGYSNLEYDLARGARGSRHDHLRALLRDLTGAEDAIVVNNNAAATVLGLAGLASGKEIVVSRGELIEIGGSFRLPEILALSGARLVEVGTTNKTHAKDYENAIGPDTGLLLKVHRSNFAIVGFTAEVTPEEVVAIGKRRGIPTMIDLGSGMLIDRERQRAWGLPDEPTVAESVASGADLVTFSGDKLLGGPQAGIAVGTAAAVERARKHPLMRALRPDKLTLAGLAATLALYRDGHGDDVPAVRMIARTHDGLHADALQLRELITSAPPGVLRGPAEPELAIGAVGGLVLAVEPCTSMVGGGAMPTAELPSWAVTVAGRPAGELDAGLRAALVPVIATIREGRAWLDVRTIAEDELPAVVSAVQSLALDRRR
jgi:L-seryl-tRNA(Ser) seleniumtransferase